MKLPRWAETLILKSLLFIAIWIAFGAPLWLGGAAWYVLGPDIFWEKLVFIAVWLFFLGWLQLVLGFTGIVLTFELITDRTL